MRRVNLRSVMPAPDYSVRGQAAAGIQFLRANAKTNWVPASAGTTAKQLLLGFLLLSAAASAATEKPAQKLLHEQTQQPLTLFADRAEWREDGVMVYEGGVRLVSGALSLSGSRVEVRQLGADQYQADVSGAPARLLHAAQEKSPAVSAESKTLFLDTKARMVHLSGDARLVRGAETLSGDSIHYDLAGRRIRAAAGSGGRGRVRMEVPGSVIAPAPQP